MNDRRPTSSLLRRLRPGPFAAGTLLVLLVVGLLLARRSARRQDTAAEVSASAALAALAPTIGPTALAVAPMPTVAEVPASVQRMSVLTVRLARNQTLGQLLSKLSLAPGQAQAILAALKDKFPFHRARPGDQIRIERLADTQSLQRFSYRQSAADEWIVAPDEQGTLRGEKKQVELTTRIERVEVEIRGSVWESLQRVNEDPALAVLASEVLAWDVDFYQDVRAGDRLKVLIEKVYADGQWLRYGDVLGTEYEGRQAGRKRLFRYTDPAGHTSYYDESGRAARRGFLRSPLRYAAQISSRFGNRVHPVLGYVQAHQGVDYRAATGTPVWSVGDGNVVQAGWNGACGKSVTVRHHGGLETVYCHLSAVNVRQGAHVSQKQVVGLVGQTGRATGPHLHYGVRRNSAFINPAQLKVPPEAPLAPQHKPDFDAKVAPLRAALDSAPVA